MPSFPQHAFPIPFPVINDCIQIGGIPVTEWHRQMGQMPFYAYDKQKILQRVQELREALPAEIQIHYAMKANPMPALVEYMADLTDGLDVASFSELQLALTKIQDPHCISFAGPGKTAQELQLALESGVLINVESANELTSIARIGKSKDINARVAVRINPDFEIRSSGMKMGGGPKPFGVDSEQVPDLLASIKSLGLQFEGFHIFTGSQCLNHDAINESLHQSVKLIHTLAKSAPAPVKIVNLGGGFGIPYFPGDQILPIKSIGECLFELRRQYAKQLPDSTWILELGRYLVGEAGVYVCQIVDRKISKGQTFLVTDGGLHHHLAASGNFGQVIRKNFPMVIGNRVQGEKRERVTVVGKLCTPLDILADNVDLSQADIGDLVVIFQSGAYGRSASPEGFLSHPPAKEILV